MPGMFAEFKLPGPPPPTSQLQECMVVHASRDESKLFVDPAYHIGSAFAPGPCEADAVFRIFEGSRAPPPPMSEEDRLDRMRRRLPVREVYGEAYDRRVIGYEDVARVCRTLVNPPYVEEEIRFFLRRFGMAVRLPNFARGESFCCCCGKKLPGNVLILPTRVSGAL